MAEHEHRLVDRDRAAIQFEDAERNQNGLGRHVVIEGFQRFGRTRFTAAGERADLDFGLGIAGDPQRVRLGRRPGAGALDALEDGVGFGDFFSGRAFKTRRSR